MKQIKLALKNRELTSLENPNEFEVVVYDYDLHEYESIDAMLIQTDEEGNEFIELVI